MPAHGVLGVWCPPRTALVLVVLLCGLLLSALPVHASSPVRPAFGNVESVLHAVDANDDAQFLALDHDASSTNVIARIGGRGRSRSDGITITRAMPRRDGVSSDVDDPWISGLVFTPSQLDVDAVHACTPTRLTVQVASRALQSVRIDDVRLESDAFVLGSDPRGVVLEPGQSVPLTIFVVVSEPQAFDAFVFVVTSLGEFALPVRGHTKPSPYGLTGLRVTVPVGARIEHTIELHNPTDELLHVTDIFSLDGVGSILFPSDHPRAVARLSIAARARNRATFATAWELLPHTTKPVARFTFHATGPTGRYRSAVRIATATLQLVVPIDIDVQRDQFIVEPRDIDSGVFTSDQEQRRVLLTFHNTAPWPVAIHEIRTVASDGLDVAADWQWTFSVIPAQSRVQHAVPLLLRENSTSYHPGPRHVQLEFKTNASDSIHTVQVRGFAMRGHIAYSLAETAFRVVPPMANASDRSPEDVVVAGRFNSRVVTLRNAFDVALELERATFSPSCADIRLQLLRVGFAPAFADFPPMRLLAEPSAAWPIATRVCSLQVETNASVHHVPVVLYSGLLRVASSRNVSEPTLPSDSCDTGATTVDERDTEETVSPEQSSPQPAQPKLCRQIVVELGRVAMSVELEDVVNITNVSPTSVRVGVQFQNTAQEKPTQVLQVDTVVSTHPDLQVSQDLVAIGAAWKQDSRGDTRSHSTLDTSLVPGHTISLRMRLAIKTNRVGVFLERAATIETDMETIHVFARFETVQGTIRPDVRSISLPMIHPGQLGFVDVPFTSTLAHDVSSQGLEISATDGHDFSSVLGVWQMPDTLPANSTTNIRLFYFPPAFYSNCQRGRFFADCFTLDKMARSRIEYSDFGGPVSQHDMKRLAAREHGWRSHSTNDGLGEPVSVIATLKTDAAHVAPVHLTAYLTRPRFFHAGGSDQTVAFPLTEILQQFGAYITVTNPSDYTIDVELAIAETDRHLFYACDEDMDEYECLHEWQDIARERVQLNKRNMNVHDDQETNLPKVAPFFFKPRRGHVLGHDQIQIGPIYFFPSSVDTWQTRIFIRNDLTHIEALTITASSGLGELSITLPPPQDASSKDHHRSLSQTSATNDIYFLLDNADDGNESTGFSSAQTLQLTNSGSYRLSFSAHLTHVESNAFRIVSDRGAVTNDPNGSHFLEFVVLAPDETASLTVEFTADCFHSQRTGELVISMRDESIHYHVVGAMTPSAAFQCRRQHVLSRASDLATRVWAAAAITGGVAVLAALFQLIRHAVRGVVPGQALSRRLDKPRSVLKSLESSAVTSEVVERTQGEEMEVLVRALAQLEDSLAPAETTGSVTAPHVAALLASRKTKNTTTAKSATQRDDNITERDKRIIDRTQIADQSSEKAAATTRPESAKTAQSTERGGPEITLPYVDASTLRNKSQNQPADAVEVNEDEEDDEVVMIEALETEARKRTPKDDGPTDLSPREDTASEDEEETGLIENQADTETIGTFFSTPEDDEKEAATSEGDLLHLNLEDPFESVSAMRPDGPEQEGTDLRLRVDFDDDWSALSFESLQSEIGKLVADDRAAPERSSPPSSSSPLHRHTLEIPSNHATGGALASLSMAPPLRPISSLFATTGSGSLPAPSLSSRPKVAKSAPPGFTAADANPAVSRVAFERLRRQQPQLMPHLSESVQSSRPSLHGFLAPGRSGAAPPLEAAFTSRYSLFGSTLNGSSLPPASTGREVAKGHIGSRLDVHEASIGPGTAPSGHGTTGL